MLKAYAVALVLSTTAPVAADKQEGAKKAPVQKKKSQLKLSRTSQKLAQYVFKLLHEFQKGAQAPFFMPVMLVNKRY